MTRLGPGHRIPMFERLSRHARVQEGLYQQHAGRWRLFVRADDNAASRRPAHWRACALEVGREVPGREGGDGAHSAGRIHGLRKIPPVRPEGHRGRPYRRLPSSSLKVEDVRRQANSSRCASDNGLSLFEGVKDSGDGRRHGWDASTQPRFAARTVTLLSGSCGARRQKPRRADSAAACNSTLPASAATCLAMTRRPDSGQVFHRHRRVSATVRATCRASTG